MFTSINKQEGKSRIVKTVKPSVMKKSVTTNVAQRRSEGGFVWVG